MRTAPASGGLVAIDITRGIAALSVFVYHYGVGFILAKKTGISTFNYIGLPGATCGVLLFFLISGFCIHWSQLKIEQRHGTSALDLRDYAFRRFWRIYPPYLIALFFSAAVLSLAGERVGALDFLRHVVLFQGFSVHGFNSINIVLWTITIEACLYVMYPLWHLVRNSLGVDWALALGVAVSSLSMGACAVVGGPFSYPVLWLPTNIWGGWLLGAWLAEKIITGSRLFRRWAWWAAGVVSYAAIALLKVSGAFEGTGYIVVPTAIILLFAWPLSAFVLRQESLVSQSTRGGRLVRDALVLCGHFSYSLYLFHDPLITLRNVLAHDWVGASRIALLIAWFFVILIAAWASYRLFEQPFISVAHRSKNSFPLVEVAPPMPTTQEEPTGKAYSSALVNHRAV